MVRGYKRVDMGLDSAYLVALEQLYNLLFRPEGVGSHIVLHEMPSEEYFVVDIDAWRNQKRSPELSAEQAMHQTAERFDTLEQAMLYFEMVKA